MIAAVDHRAFFEVARYRTEIADHHPDRERHRERKVRVDQRLVGIDKAERAPLRQQRGDQQDARKHLGGKKDEQQRVSSCETKAGDGIAGKHRHRRGGDHRDRTHPEAIEKESAERGDRRGPGIDVILEGRAHRQVLERRRVEFLPILQ